MNIQWSIKNFQELTNEELYSILKLRMITFMLEQKCVYLDLDDMDQIALHFCGKYENQLIAYARIQFDEENSLAIIRRVIIHEDFRNKQLGMVLMQKVLEYLANLTFILTVELSAQCHLQRFYEKFGFKPEGESYSDAGIMHIKMKKSQNTNLTS